jgi:hypothetical protein
MLKVTVLVSQVLRACDVLSNSCGKSSQVERHRSSCGVSAVGIIPLEYHF